MTTNFQSPNLQREIIRKKLNDFFKFSSGNLLYHLLSADQFEAPSCKYMMYYEDKFSKLKYAKGDNLKKK